MSGLLPYTTARDISCLNYSVNGVFCNRAKWLVWADSLGSLFHQPTTVARPSPDFLHCCRNLSVYINPLTTATSKDADVVLPDLSEGLLHPEAMEDIHSKPCTPIFCVTMLDQHMPNPTLHLQARLNTQRCSQKSYFIFLTHCSSHLRMPAQTILSSRFCRMGSESSYH